MSDGPLTTPIERVRGLSPALAALLPLTGGTLTGPLTAPQFNGPLNGNATSATTAASLTGNVAQSQVTGLSSALALLATLANPTFTGTVTIPTLNVSGGINGTTATLTSALQLNPANFSTDAFTLWADPSHDKGVWWTGIGGVLHLRGYSNVDLKSVQQGAGIQIGATVDVTGLLNASSGISSTAGNFSGNLSAGRFVLPTADWVYSSDGRQRQIHTNNDFTVFKSPTGWYWQNGPNNTVDSQANVANLDSSGRLTTTALRTANGVSVDQSIFAYGLNIAKTGAGVRFCDANNSQHGTIGLGSLVATGGVDSDFGITSLGNLLFQSGGVAEQARLSTAGNLLLGLKVDDTVNRLQVAGGGAFSGQLTLNTQLNGNPPFLVLQTTGTKPFLSLTPGSIGSGQASNATSQDLTYNAHVHTFNAGYFGEVAALALSTAGAAVTGNLNVSGTIKAAGTGTNAAALTIGNLSGGDSGSVPTLISTNQSGVEAARITTDGSFRGSQVTSLDKTVGWQFIPGSRLNLIGNSIWLQSGASMRLYDGTGSTYQDLQQGTDGLLSLRSRATATSWSDLAAVIWKSTDPGGTPRTTVSNSGAVTVNVYHSNGAAGWGAVVPLTVKHDGDGSPTGNLVEGYVGSSLIHSVSKTGAAAFSGAVAAPGFTINTTAGASGSYTTADGKTVVVSGGLITSIL